MPKKKQKKAASAAKRPGRTIIGGDLPNIPWEERPSDCREVVWRYSRNPVIPWNLIPCSNSIFNSAVAPYKDRFEGVFRIDDKSRNMRLHHGWSKDGFTFEMENEPVKWICPDPEIAEFIEAYDPRVGWVEDRYYITWCNNYHGYTIGMGYTHDFKKFYQMENSFLPYNRNGVLFPRKIDGKYAMLSRPSDTGHTPFGDIFYSESPDMIHWGRHRWVMSPKAGKQTWQCTKIGAGPIPIETTEGWLLIYHGVITSCQGFEYSMGAAILDIRKPWKVRYRTKPYLLAPSVPYEQIGHTQNVVFPCAALADAATGRLAVYYGAADTVVGLAFCHVDELIKFIKANSEV